ncbi:MAG: hypothetical protein K2M55_02210 [Muribaculaceae bacterium]|nr:hypothetical protein [Muribaculaceae bacterium]
MASTFQAQALSKTFYYKVTVTAPEGEGTVCVTDGSIPADNLYATNYSNTFSASIEYRNPFSPPTSTTGNASLYAKPEKGYILSHWLDKDGKKVTSASLSLSASGTNTSNATAYSYTAVFERSMLEIYSDNETLGKVSVKTGTSFGIGSTVTVQATKVRVYKGEMGNLFSSAHKFLGWYDQHDNCVSTDAEYTFTIQEYTVLTARFSLERYVTGNGYYRCHWLARITSDTKEPEYMTLRGDYAPFTSIPSGRTTTAPIIEFHSDPNDPGCIVRMKGTYKDPGDDLSGEFVVIDNLEMYAQGVSTTEILDGFNLQIRQAHNFGYNKITAEKTILGFKQTGVLECGSVVNADPTKLAITANHDTNEIQDVNSYFDFQPIDEAHVDTFYWGVESDESMKDDEGKYWASMYASYPYYMYDDIEVYYISEFKELNGEPVAMLKRIESGEVPANTPVLLRCSSASASKNRMIPSMNDYPEITDNLLKGSYQLNSKTVNKTTFNKSSMRVLNSLNVNIGFYAMEEGTELTANRAWLDVSTLSVNQVARLRMCTEDEFETAGISMDYVPETTTGIYDLYGRKVETMLPGNLYIVNGKKVYYRE